MQNALDNLKINGFKNIGIWVLETNQIGIKFYNSIGAIDTNTKRKIKIGGEDLVEKLFMLFQN